MTEWIRKGERITSRQYRREFDWEGETGWGFSFPCDADGKPLDDEHKDVWWKNWEACLSGVVDGQRVVDRGIVSWDDSYWEPGVIRCSMCSGEVVLDHTLTNTCDNCRDCGEPGDIGRHLLTTEQCAELMSGHLGIGAVGTCQEPGYHHPFVACEVDYNMSGQRLAPREQWGWDTGESLSDILMADRNINDREWLFEDEYE